jgi:hypothetical protein
VLHGGHWRQSAFQSYLVPVVVHFTNIYAVKISAKITMLSNTKVNIKGKNYFKTSSKDIQKTPSEAPFGMSRSRRWGVHVADASAQSPFHE